MNGFLLEVARQYMVRFSAMRDDTEREQEWTDFGKVLQQRLQDAWKGDFFARAYLNRPNALNASWLGGMDDGLSDDPALSGTYFLNSFSWSVLSGVATDEQVSTMLDRIEAVLLTPYGIRLSSPTRFKELMPNAGSGDYAYGDRENGGVFKHATMMAVSALLEGARTVDDAALAARMAEMGWSVLQMVAPFKTMSDPFILAGNPRLCTQYTNPATGEHVGPLLSGTAPWMWMGYMKIFGVDFRDGKLVVDPVLPEAWEQASLQLNVPAGRYEVSIAKGTGFARCRGGGLKVQVGGEACEGPLPAAAEGEICKVEVMG
jgi:cellobiose phosphorylase